MIFSNLTLSNRYFVVCYIFYVVFDVKMGWFHSTRRL